ncbi:MAG: ATP-binding cassette domain-containing protein [Patescibacteria group bacterium]
MSEIIRAKNVTKSFVKTKFNWRTFELEKEEKIAVNSLDLSIESGEFVGFLGPNGAGKTTFLKILSGIVYPTSGTVEVMGYIPWERDYKLLRHIAIVMGQKNQLWWDLPAIDSYKMLKEVYSISDKDFKKNLDRMAEILQMHDLLKKRLRDMSLGERMKCELVACFLHDPKVIFLDEPTIGLDVVSSQAIRSFLKDINKTKKCTMILTSHYMGDIESLCDRVVIINHGAKIYDGKLASLKAKFSDEKRIEIFLPNLEDRQKFAHLKIDNKSITDGKGLIYADRKNLGEIVNAVYSHFEAGDISITDPDTEEVITKVFQGQNINL